MVFEMADDGGSIMPMDEVALYKTTHPVKTFNSKCPVQRIRMSEMSGTSYSNAIRKDQDELVRFNLANITLENVDQQYRLCFYDHSQEWVIDTGIELTIRSGWSLDQTELDPLALQPVTIFEQVRSKAWAAYYLAEINIPADPTMQNEEMPSAPFVFREDDAVRLCTPSCPTVNRSLLYLDPYGRPAGLAGADPYDKGLARTWAIKNWTDDFNEPSASPYCSSAVKFREVGFLTRPSVEVPPHAGFLNMDLRAGYKVYFNFTGITGQRMRQNYNLCYLHTDTLKEDGGHGVFNYDTGVRVFVKSGWVIDKKILFPDANVTVFVQEKALSHDAQITITIPATNFGAQAVGVAVTQAGSGATGTLVRFGAGIVTTADALKLSASPISGEGLTATITTQVSAVTVSAQDITTDGVGTGLVLEYTSSSGAITGITVTISGAGYTVGDRITIAHGAMDGRSTNAVFKLMPDDLLDPTIVVVTWTNTIPFDTTNAITVGDSTPATPPVPTATEVSKDEIGFFAESCPKTIGEWHDREALQDWRAAHAGTMPHHTSNSSQNIIALPTDLTHGMYMGFNFSTTPTQLLNKYWSLCVNNNGIIVDTGRQIFLTGWRLETKVTHVTASSNVKLRISEHQMNTLDSDRDRLFFTPRECPTYAQWGAEVAMADTSTEKATGAVSMHAGLDITFSFATVSAVTYRNQPFRMCFLNNAAGTVTDTGIVVTMTGWSSVAALGTFIAAQGQHLTLKALESEQVGIGTKLAWFQDKCPDSPIDYTASVGLRTNSSSISVTLSEAEQITALKSEAGLTLTFDLSFMKSETRVPREITLTIPATDFSTGIVTLTIPLTDFGLQAKGVTVTQATTGAEGTLKVVLSMATVTVVVVPTNNNAFDTSNAITVGGHATTPTPTAAVVSGPTAGEEVTQDGTLAAGTLIRYGAGLVTDVDALLLSADASFPLAAAITANTDEAVVHTSITTDGFGTGLELVYTASSSAITSITVTKAGTGYRVGDVITIAHAAMAGRATNAVFTLVADDLSNPTTIVVTATKLVAFDFIVCTNPPTCTTTEPVTATTGGHAINVGSPTAFGVSHPIPTAAVVTKTAIINNYGQMLYLCAYKIPSAGAVGVVTMLQSTGLAVHLSKQGWLVGSDDNGGTTAHMQNEPDQAIVLSYNGGDFLNATFDRLAFFELHNCPNYTDWADPITKVALLNNFSSSNELYIPVGNLQPPGRTFIFNLANVTKSDISDPTRTLSLCHLREEGHTREKGRGDAWGIVMDTGITVTVTTFKLYDAKTPELFEKRLAPTAHERVKIKVPIQLRPTKDKMAFFEGAAVSRDAGRGSGWCRLLRVGTGMQPSHKLVYRNELTPTNTYYVRGITQLLPWTTVPRDPECVG